MAGLMRLTTGHDCPDDAGHFVGHGYTGHTGGFAGKQREEARIGRVGFVPGSADQRGRANVGFRGAGGAGWLPHKGEHLGQRTHLSRPLVAVVREDKSVRGSWRAVVCSEREAIDAGWRAPIWGH